MDFLFIIGGSCSPEACREHVEHLLPKCHQSRIKTVTSSGSLRDLIATSQQGGRRVIDHKQEIGDRQQPA